MRGRYGMPMMNYDRNVHFYCLNGKRVDVREEVVAFRRDRGRLAAAVDRSVENLLRNFCQTYADGPDRVGFALESLFSESFGTVGDWLPEDPDLVDRLAEHVDQPAASVFVSSVLSAQVSGIYTQHQVALNRPGLLPEQRSLEMRRLLEDVRLSVSKSLADYLKGVLEAALSQAIGPVWEGMDLCRAQQKIKREAARGDSLSDDELGVFLSLVPDDPRFVSVALERFGDFDSGISSVAEAFGLSCRRIKLELLSRISDNGSPATEADALAALTSCAHHVPRLSLDEDPDAKACLAALRSKADAFDHQFRTVGGIVYPTRLEAELTRRDVNRLREELGEDPTPCLGYARLVSGQGMPIAGKKNGRDLTERLVDLLNAFPKRQDESPFLAFVRRAFEHARDFGHFAGNERHPAWRQAEEARREKAIRLTSRVAASPDPRKDFALDADLFPSGVKGMFSFFKKESPDASVGQQLVARYYGERLPENAHDLAGLLRWQAGFDLLDACPDSCREISPEGLPKGAVSTRVLSAQNGFADVLGENGDVTAFVSSVALRPIVLSSEPPPSALPMPRLPSCEPTPVEPEKPLVATGRERAVETTPQDRASVAPTNQGVGFCRKCGAELVQGARFCRKCGARVGV